MREISQEVVQIRANRATLEKTYRSQVIPEDPPLVAGKAEKLARVSATIKFNAALKGFLGSRYNSTELK